MNRSRSQRPCSRCGTALVAMVGVEFCFGCWPGGSVTPPPFLGCGSRRGYHTGGLCVYCHPSSTPPVDSCRDCLAWGAKRTNKWLCRACAGWRRENPTVGPCPICGRRLHLSERYGVCRLCYCQARMLRPPGGKHDFVAANRYGAQLFFADVAKRRPAPRPPPSPGLVVLDWVQPALFTVARDLATHGRTGLPEPADPQLAAGLDRRADEHAAAHGWNKKLVNNTRNGLRIVLGLHEFPGTLIKASDVAALAQLKPPVWAVREVLAEAGMLDDDRADPFPAWFAQQVAGVPEPMAGELETWFELMCHGSVAPPRRRPRTPTTIRLLLQWTLSILRGWAAAGDRSLREITKDDVLDALPAAGDARAQAGQGLRSIFVLLRSRRIGFLDPTVRVQTGYFQPHQPVPAELATIREALHSPKPARAVLVALIAFCGLRVGQLQRLRLTDIHDGRLHLHRRAIVLADPVRERLTAWLDHRNRRWPQTANPHLFLNQRTDGRIDPVGYRWVRLTLGPGLSVSAIREDRILNEAHATGGDARRIADLFGLSIQAGTRYTATVDHPDLVRHTTATTNTGETR
jgi:integrase